MDTQAHYYKTLAREGSAEFKDRGSRFVAFAFPVTSPEEFKERLNALKKDHARADHHCFAFRIGVEDKWHRISDDGEPAGTAGRPILGQIDSKGLTNAAVVVVRYFGGTLLGVPGLINAYKTSASLCLQVIPEVEKAIEKVYRIQCHYPLMHEVMLLCKHTGCTILKAEPLLFCELIVGIPRAREEGVLHGLKKMADVVVEPYLQT